MWGIRIFKSSPNKIIVPILNLYVNIRYGRIGDFI